MRWKGSYLAGALALAVVGCNGRSGTDAQAPAPAVPQAVNNTPAATTPTGVAACTNGVTVRLVGVNPSHTTQTLVLEMASLVGYFADNMGHMNVIQATNPATWPLDVTTDAVTHDLGTLAIPLDQASQQGGIIQVTFSGGTGSAFNVPTQAIDVCTQPLQILLETWRLAKMSCLIEIALDVGRSVNATPDGGISFMPTYRVLFQEKP